MQDQDILSGLQQALREIESGAAIIKAENAAGRLTQADRNDIRPVVEGMRRNVARIELVLRATPGPY